MIESVVEVSLPGVLGKQGHNEKEPLTGSSTVVKDEGRFAKTSSRDSKVSIPMRTSSSLSAIPEQSKSVSNYFQVVLAGCGASDFAGRVCESELSEAYRPRALTRTRRCSPRVQEDAQDADGLVDTPMLGQVDTSSSSERASRESRLSLASTRSMTSTAELCFFCPLDASIDRLACLNFQTVEGFSASLPPIKSEAEARDTCVVLLHWPEAGMSGPSGVKRAEAEDNSLMDLRRRVAELNFQAKFVPNVFVLCVANTHAENERAREAVGACKFHGRSIAFLCSDGDSEEDLGSALQSLADMILREQDGPGLRLPGGTAVLKGKSACCSTM
jgi:hypothetical protein